MKIRSGKIGRKKKPKIQCQKSSHSAGCIADPLSCHPPPPKKKRYMPPPRRKSSLSSNDDAAKKKKPSEEEEEDRHAVEMLRRLEDLGVDLPSKSMAPNALRNHKRDPLGFVAIASQLATIIEPLIEMTGADNPTLARRSCETIRTLGPGTSEEDRASRALGALAVLAVGQMGASIFQLNLEKLCLVVVVYVVVRFLRDRREGKQPCRLWWSFFSSRRHRYHRQKSLASALCPTRFI